MQKREGPESMPQESIALVAFDLDGTLLRKDSAGVLMARALGREEQMHYFEALRVREVFIQAREEMVSWYRTTTFEQLTECFFEAKLAPGALEAFALLRVHGIKTALVSCGWEFGIAWFA